MYTCLNKFRDRYGNIIGYTLISYVGIQYITHDELIKLLKEHKIYVSNLRVENGRILDYNNHIQKACNYIQSAITKDHWVTGGLMKSHRLDYLDEFYTKFEMLVSKGNNFAKNIQKKFNIEYNMIYYPDTMDCRWEFINGVTLLLDKMTGKLIIYNYIERLNLDDSPLQIIELRMFGGPTL